MAYKGPQVVVGPGSATDTAIARWNGTTGEIVQNISTTTIDSNGNLITTKAVAAGSIELRAENSQAGDTAADARLMAVTSATGGSPFVLLSQSGAGIWAAGVDVVADSFKISAGGSTPALGTSYVEIDVTGDITITPNTGAVVVGTASSSTSISQLRSGSGQWLNWNDATDSFGFYNNAGTPEAVVAANIGSLCTDTTNGELYRKTTDTVNTGWIKFSDNAAMVWTEVTGTTQAIAVDNGYVANNAGLVILTLPATAVIGDIVKVDGKGAGGWLIAQNAGQTVHFLGQDTTTGVGGSLASSTRYDCVTYRCITANTDWVMESVVGNLTVV